MGTPRKRRNLRQNQKWRKTTEEEETTPYDTTWNSLLQLAHRFKIFRLSSTTTHRAEVRLASLPGLSADLDEVATRKIAKVICLASLEEEPIFTAAMLGERQTFRAHCISALVAVRSSPLPDGSAPYLDLQNEQHLTTKSTLEPRCLNPTTNRCPRTGHITAHF